MAPMMDWADKSIPGPVLLVGLSYRGPVNTSAANSTANVKALVYVAGFLPDTGESSLTLSAKFPGSTLGSSLTTIALPDGDQDLYIQRDKFRTQFAADAVPTQAAAMAATHRPVTLSALGWRSLMGDPVRGVAAD